VALHRGEDCLDLRGLAHEEADRLLRVLSRRRQEALERLAQDLQTDWAMLEPLRRNLDARMNVPRYLATAWQSGERQPPETRH
jgi:hypothetical protein